MSGGEIKRAIVVKVSAAESEVWTGPKSKAPPLAGARQAVAMKHVLLDMNASPEERAKAVADLAVSMAEAIVRQFDEAATEH